MEWKTPKEINSHVYMNKYQEEGIEEGTWADMSVDMHKPSKLVSSNSFLGFFLILGMESMALHVR